jgi:hypothetical protein
VTDAARFYLDADLTTSGLRNWAVDNFEASPGLADLNSFHAGLVLSGGKSETARKAELEIEETVFATQNCLPP